MNKNNKIMRKRICTIVAIILSIIVLLLVYDKQKHSGGLHVTPSYTEAEGLEFGKDVMRTGNETSYEQLIFSPIDRVPYSFVMANKYNSANGCWAMYSYITELFKNNNIEIDSLSESIALGYLKRGADLGDKWCIQYIISTYKKGGKFFSPDTSLANYYRKKLDKINMEGKNHE